MFFPMVIASKQTMTEAEHNRQNPKFFDNRLSASVAEVFGEIIGLRLWLPKFFGLLIGHWKIPKKGIRELIFS